MQHWSSISSLCLFTFVALLLYSATSWGIVPDPTDTFPISSRTLIPWWFSSSLLASLPCSGQPSIEVMTVVVLISPGTCTFTRPYTGFHPERDGAGPDSQGRGKSLLYTATKIPYIYSFSGNSAASTQISTFMCLWAIYIVPGSVYIFPPAE